jgi:flavin-dependent dehydrogenase
MDSAVVRAAVRAGASFWDQAHAQVLPLTDSNSRQVRIARAGQAEVVSARAVLVCDGLGHPSLSALPEFRCQVARGSRVGLGAVIDDPTGELPPGLIHLAVGCSGYVGAVRAEDAQVCVAAAVDRAALAEASPLQVVTQILRESKSPWGALLTGAELRGTRPLTQHATKLGGERLFVVGDAAGYVEPFTGEGMAIALESALAVAPLAIHTCDSWRPELAAQWSADVRRISAQRQRVIRSLAWFLRRPRLLRSGLALAGLSPGVVRMVTRRMNRPTAARST